MTGKTNPTTGLQEQQQRFADEYLIDFNATAAYARAGYKSKGAAAWTAASRLLGNPNVQKYLATRRTELTRRIEVDQAGALQNIIDMAQGDIRCLINEDGDIKPLNELTREQACLIQGFEAERMHEWIGSGEERVREWVGTRYKYKLVNMVEVRKLLGMHHGLFNPSKKVELTGKDGKPLQTQQAALGELLDMVGGADTGPGAARGRKATAH